VCLLPWVKRNRPGALVYRSLGANFSAVAVNDALNGREPNARPFELFSAMQPLEHAEQLMRVLHFEPCPIVSDVDFDLVITFVDRAGRTASLRIGVGRYELPRYTTLVDAAQ
jgi:hypothetical protein